MNYGFMRSPNWIRRPHGSAKRSVPASVRSCDSPWLGIEKKEREREREGGIVYRYRHIAIEMRAYRYTYRVLAETSHCVACPAP